MYTVGKLGKQLPKRDPRTLKLGSYLYTLPPAPTVCDWKSNILQWGMMRNDSLGDCTIAAVGHAIQGWSAATGTEITLSDDTIEAYYSKWDGYVPGDPNTDNGGVELDVLNQWRQQGIGESPDLMHKIFAYAACEPLNVEHVRQSVYLFGGVYIGLALPLTAQDQVGKVWDVVGDGSSEDAAPGSWGGHAVWVPYLDPDNLECVTWGSSQKMTWKFWKKYCDESYAILSADWVTERIPTMMGFNLQVLTNDLQAIAG